MKRLFLVVTILLCVSPVAFAQGTNVGSTSSPITNSFGQALSGVNVAICTHPATIGNSTTPCAPLANTYTDNTLAMQCNGSNGCSNGLTVSDGLGNWNLWVQPGTYDLQFYGLGFTTTLKTVVLAGLVTTPTQCTGANVAQGVAANGNANCTKAPVIVAEVNLTAQQASITDTPFYTAATSGMYRLSCYAVVTQVAGMTSTLPNCQLSAWTDADTSVSEGPVSVTGQSSTNTLGTASTNVNANTGFITGMISFNAKSGTTIDYSTANYASAGSPVMQYALHIRLEYLGP